MIIRCKSNNFDQILTMALEAVLYAERQER